MDKSNGVLTNVTNSDLELLKNNPEKFWEGVTEIGSFAFRGLDIEELRIPKGVTRVGTLAFDGCVKLKSIFVSETVTDLVEIAPFFGCKNLETIEVDKNNPRFKSQNNCLLTKDGQTLIAACKNSVVPKGVKTISDLAFCNCEGLEKVNIPIEVEHLDINSFEFTDIARNNGKIEIEYEEGKSATISFDKMNEIDNSNSGSCDLSMLRQSVAAMVRNNILQPIAAAALTANQSSKEKSGPKEK